MSVTAVNVTGSFPNPSVLQSPISGLVSLSAGQPFTRHWWVRPVGAGGGGAIINAGNFQVYPRNVSQLLIRVLDGAGNLADWNATNPDALWSSAEFRSLLITYDGSNVRAWVEGVEVPLTRSGIGTGVIAAGGTHYVINSSPQWNIDEPAFVRGQVIGDPSVFRAGPATQRRISTLAGLTYWVRFEAANQYLDSGPNALAMALQNDPGFTSFSFGPGVALEPAAAFVAADPAEWAAWLVDSRRRA